MGRTATTDVLPIWRSEAQPAILHALMFRPGEHTAATIARQYGLPRQAVGVEARRLEGAGLVRRRHLGRTALLEVSNDHPATSALRTLVDLTIGPFMALQRMYELGGVERVYVFGSWARRHRGEPGPAPRDLDVLVVGDADPFAVADLCLELSGEYSLDIGPATVTPAQFDEPDADPLLSAIVTGPLVEVPRP